MKMKTNTPLPSAEKLGLVATLLLAAAIASASAADIYRFNSAAAGEAGWTIDGVYDGDSDVAISGTCDPNTYMWRLGGESYDFPLLSRSGCLAVMHPGTCFPADEATSGFVRYDFVSPVIFDHHDLEKYFLAVRSNMPGVWVQPLLEVRDGSGGTKLLREVTSSGAGVFTELTEGSDWEQIGFTRPGKLSEKVVRLRVRIFIENSTLAIYGGREAMVYLDYVTLDHARLPLLTRGPLISSILPAK